MPRIPRSVIYSLALAMLSLVALPADGGVADIGDSGPPLSSTALLSRFAHVHGLAPDIPENAVPFQPSGEEPPDPQSPPGVSEIRVNQDYSEAPQNETTIAVNPASPNMIVAGANDYRLGVPVGAAFYTSFDGGVTWTDGFSPFPLLAGRPEPSDSDSARFGLGEGHAAPGVEGGMLTEPPSGTGDPVIAFGPARAGSPGLTFGASVAYYVYLGVSSSFCEHGIFVTRSTNGLTWTRPVVPPLFPPSGLFTPVYWDRPNDCGVFNDKPWIAVDQSNGPHRGRVYVVWARFVFNDGKYRQSSIEMVYSDDNAQTWSPPITVNGVSPELCPAQVGGKAGRCDESQFATIAVGPDGTLHVAFLNQQSKGEDDGFRNQYLITSVDPDTLAVSGPYRAASMIDGFFEFPVNHLGQATLCNSNFRMNTAGNLALDPSDPEGKTMYIVFADNRNGSSFPGRPPVTQDPPDSFFCPEGTNTDTDIFIVRSTDGGVTWRNPATGAPGDLRVNQDGPGKDQWFPFAAVGPAGQIAVVFHDRRDDFFNRAANVYLARSSDGGATWTETKLTSVPSNLNWAFENGVFIGDYNGVAIGPDGVSYPFWTDARNGNSLVRQSDVYMAIVPP